MNSILHIARRADWLAAVASGHYKTSSLDLEGFIHCSTAAQVVGTAKRFFAGQKDLVLLGIDVNKVEAEVKYEAASGGALYPHIYGSLNVSAVVRVFDFAADANGEFVLPAGIVSD
jgi:uncharacterized protein (DUF952 family)